jgi:hypothetical protein
MFPRVSIQHPYFGQCVRLCKRWVASQLMLREDLLPEEAVELVCAHLYLQPAPNPVPKLADFY